MYHLTANCRQRGPHRPLHLPVAHTRLQAMMTHHQIPVQEVRAGFCHPHWHPARAFLSLLAGSVHSNAIHLYTAASLQLLLPPSPLAPTKQDKTMAELLSTRCISVGCPCCKAQHSKLPYLDRGGCSCATPTSGSCLTSRSGHLPTPTSGLPGRHTQFQRSDTPAQARPTVQIGQPPAASHAAVMGLGRRRGARPSIDPFDAARSPASLAAARLRSGGGLRGRVGIGARRSDLLGTDRARLPCVNKLTVN